jgi:hypothetical protein
MQDFSLARFTMKPDCHLTCVAFLRSSNEELWACSTCRATLLIKSGAPPTCPVNRLLDYQRSRISSHAANQP